MDLVRTGILNHKTTQFDLSILVDEYGDLLYKFCRSLTFSKEDADDLFQETFSSVIERHSKLNLLDNPKGVLFSTSLYIWKSWKRKYARRNRLVPIIPFEENMQSYSNTEEHLLEQEEIRVVKQLVHDLPDKYKTPTILYYTAEMSISEISSVMKLPSGTVKSRLFKARKLIEKGLEAAQYVE